MIISYDNFILYSACFLYSLFDKYPRITERFDRKASLRLFETKILVSIFFTKKLGQKKRRTLLMTSL